MQLPEKTASFARATVDGWEDDLPQRIYDTAAELDYGLSGALEQGINLRYPHEVEEETNCHERAVYTYSLASALDLEPRFFEIEEDWEDPLKHAWIDVEWDGERYVIDPAQNRFGRVVSYGDQKLRVETPDGNTETKEYAFIEQRNEETIAQDIKDLREDTVAMIQDGQKLGELTEGQTKIYDKVNFDREENAFERMASFYDPVGFLNHLIRSRTYVSMDGEQKNTETLFADIDDAGWKHAWGERELAQIVDGERRLQDRSEIDDAALENMVRVVSYEQGCPDQELRYSEKEREQTWQDLQDRLEQLPDEPTGFRGRHAQNEIERLAALREKDQQAFQREMDWRTYLRKNRMIKVPDKQYEEILKQYIERHTETHYTIRQSDHQNAVETAKQQLNPSLSSQRQTIEETITELEEQGGDYQELAGDLQAIKNGDHVENPVEQYDTLLLSDRNARQATQQVLRQADSSVSDDYHERFHQLFTSNETAAFPIDAVEDTVTLDPDGRELRIERRFDDGSISPYQTIVELEVSFDPNGTVNQRTASFYETKKNTDARYDLGSLEFDDLDDIGLEAVQETAREQLDEILSTRHLEAPEPVSDRDFLDRNNGAIGLYSIMYQDPEEMPLIFDRGTLDDFRSRLIQEAEWTIESPYQPVDEKKEALREINEFRSIEDDAWELYGQMQHNKLESLRQKGEEERARDLIAEAFPTETEQMEAYARKLYFLFEEHVQDQSERLEGLTEIASDRIQQEEGFPQLSVEEVAGLLEEAVQTR